MAEAFSPLKRRLPRRLSWSIGGLLLLLLSVYGGWRWWLHRPVAAELARWDAAGYPTSYAEMGEWYREPAEPNVASVYLEAAQRYVRDEDLEEQLPEVGLAEAPAAGVEWPAEMRGRVEAYLERHDGVLGLLLSNREPTAGRYPIAFELGADALLPHLGEIRRLGRLLALAAIYRAAHGDAAGAFAALRALGCLAESLHEEPLAISQVVRLSLYTLMVHTAAEVIERSDPGEAELAALQRQLERVSWRDAVIGSTIDHRVMQEAIFTGSVFSAAEAIRNGLIAPRTTTYQWWLTGELDRERFIILRDLNDLMALQRTRDTPLTDADFHPVPEFSLSGILYGSVQNLTRSFATGAARVDAAATGVAVARFRRGEGRYPVTLDELVPEYLEAVPEDLFAGGPMRYRLEPDGFIVYSVGVDGVDDGGRERDRHGASRDGTDVPFTVGPLQARLWPAPPPRDEGPYANPYLGLP